MGKGFKHGSGDGKGGTELNFSVVACAEESSLPETVSGENVICVITQTPVSQWIFSAQEPDTAEEGMVWIRTGTASTVEFNALKQNAIQVYPLKASQYIDGVWTEAAAKIYQDGQWKNFMRYLYHKGEEQEEITGGWNVLGVANDNYSTWNAITEKNSDHMRLGVSASSSLNRLLCAQTVKKVNLSDAGTLGVEYEISGTTDGIVFGLAVSSAAYTASTILNSFEAETRLSADKTTAKLDISGITGEYYIIVRMWMGSSASANTILKTSSVYIG